MLLVARQNAPARDAWLGEFRATLALAWPMVLTNLAQIALTTTDVIVVGRLGASALAAATLGVNLYFGLLIFAIGLVSATSPMMAEVIGRNHRVVREVRRLSPKTKILIVTAFYDATSVRELISAGASGMLLKDETSGKFVLAVRTVAQGGYWFSPLAVKGLIESPADTARSSNRKLTGREREILILVTQGMSNEQIAEKLELSSQTVRNYISRIYSKLGVRSRTEAVTWAREQGLRSS